MRSFVGSTGVLVRAYAYLRAHGDDGPARGVGRRGARRELPQARACGEAYDIPFDRACKHEFVASAAGIKQRTGVRTLDVAKRLIDKGYHPPTIYFPLTVEEGMLIEPTETESLETLDGFADALIEIAARGRDGPGARDVRAARRAGPPPRRGHRGPPAEPPLARHDRRPDALPGLTPAPPNEGLNPGASEPYGWLQGSADAHGEGPHRPRDPRRTRPRPPTPTSSAAWRRGRRRCASRSCSTATACPSTVPRSR